MGPDHSPCRTFSVTRLILRKRRQLYAVPVQCLQHFNRFVITVDLSDTSPGPYSIKEGDILIRKHILDKQIVDVNGAKVVRVNDLKLGDADGSVCVIGIDAANGIEKNRRGSLIQKALQTFNRPIKESVIGWHYLQTMDPHLRHLTLNVAKKQLGELHPSDLAQILTEVAPDEGTEILASVDEELAGEALHEVPDEVREKILREMDKAGISDILEEMPPDEAADPLRHAEEKSEELLSLMEKEDAEEVKDLLSYEEDTAGGLMTTEFLDFTPDMTIEEAMTDIRLLIPDVEFIYYIYIVDNEDHLLGVVTLKKILTNPLYKTLQEVMTQNVKAVHFDTGRKEIAEMISKYDIIALPVVDDDNRILGIITVDDIIDLLVPNPTRRRKKR